MSAINLAALATASQEEVARQMVVCNACRYCEGLCAVFPAMELRRDFSGGDVDYLSNLCHNCGACYYDCQYAPPHEFAINVPVAMAELREETYARYVWPKSFAPLFERNGLWVRWGTGMGAAFLWMLLLTSATGLLLLLLRATPAMGMLLAVHLGIVFPLFLSFPYGKFVHGIYRFAALTRHAHEQRVAHGAPAEP